MAMDSPSDLSQAVFSSDPEPKYHNSQYKYSRLLPGSKCTFHNKRPKRVKIHKIQTHIVVDVKGMGKRRYQVFIPREEVLLFCKWTKQVSKLGGRLG
jgi:hypothetical protein